MNSGQIGLFVIMAVCTAIIFLLTHGPSDE